MADYVPCTSYDNKPYDTFDQVKTRPVGGSVTATINASVGEVWALVGNYGCEKAYFGDMLDKVELFGHGVGAIRRISFGGFKGLPGFKVDERLEVIEPEKHRILYSKLDVDDDPYPAKGVTGMVELKALSENSTEVTWTSHAIAPAQDPEQRKKLKDETEKRYAFMIGVYKDILGKC